MEMKRTAAAVAVAAAALTTTAWGIGKSPPAEQRRNDERLAEMVHRLDQIEQDLSEMRGELARLADGLTTMMEPRIEHELERRLQGA